jgi:hypothetical protein
MAVGAYKYLTFTPWQGDLNNTRMCFETALVFAYLTGRCLVMPRQYRQCFEPEIDDGKFRPLHPGHLFDLNGLSGVVTLVSDENYEHVVGSDRPDDRVEVTFEPGTTVFCFPRIPPAGSSEAAALHQFAASRQGRLEMTPEMQACRTLHLRTPMLEHFYTFVYTANPRDTTDYKQLIRDHVRFHQSIVLAADHIVATLGDFGAVHVRRNDFVAQYPAQDLAADRVLASLRPRVPSGSRLYVATDEADKRFFDCFQQEYDVYFADQFQAYFPENVDPSLLACIEQEVCARATVFVGTRLSTFSGYITRLRGYHGAQDTASYFTDGAQGSELDDRGKPSFSWINWLQLGHPLWGREFREAWEF